MTAMTALITPRDARDKAWLDAHVERLADGIEAARAIWSNWHQGRNVGRLYPGMTAGDYIESRGFRLTLGEALEALPDASSREVAKVAGVHHSTVAVARAGVGNPTPATVTGADGKQYPTQKEAPPAKPARAIPPIVIVDHYDKVFAAMNAIYAADPGHLLAHINAQASEVRAAVRDLMTTTATTLTKYSREIVP